MSFPSQGYVPTTIPLARVRDTIGSTVVIVDEKWFAIATVPDVDDNLASQLIIEFAFSVRAIISVSIDNGVSWYKMNNNNKVEAETLNSFEFPVLNTDQILIRSDTAGTVRFARILELV